MTIRVLVVDDSALVRRIVTQALDGLDGIEVAGTAANGKIALAKIPAINPDVITLDIEMPEMDGITAMREIRKSYPALPVIMFSTLTERGAHATFEALAAGARDYVTKPTNSTSLAQSIETIRTDLGTRIRALVGARPVNGTSARTGRLSPAAGPEVGHLVRPATTTTVDAVAIGASTGGPDTLAQVLKALPADLPVPVFIVQHMPPVFTRMLADRFDKQNGLHVVEAADGMPVRPGTVYLAPGDWHMRVVKDRAGARIRLDQGTPENFVRPAVDVLFRSLPAVYGNRLLAVVLTGMGSDGLSACKQLAADGVDVYAQDQASSVVWGMPGAVTTAGLATKVLSLPQIAPAITDRVRLGRGGAR